MINAVKRGWRRYLVERDTTPIRLEAKHALAIRWFHWINFPAMIVMVWSGLIIYWAVTGPDSPDKNGNGIYTVTIFGHRLFHFFPDNFFELPGYAYTNPVYSLNGRLAEGMGWHFLFMWIFTINGILYALYLAFSGEWRYILPSRTSFKDSILVLLHDLQLIKKAPPRRKFNGAQQIAYTCVILMGLGSVLTGIAIYKPIQASLFTRLMGGYEMARFFHFWLMILFVLFFMVHVIQVIHAGWNNFRAMITGYEVVSVEEEA